MNDKVINQSLAARLMHGARDLVWQDDPVPQNRSDEVPVVATAPQPAKAELQSVAPSGMTAELLALLMNRPTAFSALTEAIAALADIPMDEATRYRAAFAVLKQTQQRNVEQIAQAIDVHLGMLESERARFSAQSQSAEQEGITARVNEIAALNASVEEINRQVLALRSDTEARVRRMQEELQAKQDRARELSRQTEQKKQAIAATTRNFDAAADAVKSRLAGEKAKVQRYLGQESLKSI